MSAPTNFQDFRNARAALQAAREDSARKLFAREQARQALTDVLRQFEPASTQGQTAQGDLTSADDLLTKARKAESDARDALNNLVGPWLKDEDTGADLDPDGDFTRLEDTTIPVVLLPVRLETRFDLARKVLMVRIYPDEISSDMHEQTLTPEEKSAGDDYWRGVGGETPESVDRWSSVADRFGVPRAAYIVRARQPGLPTQPPLRMETPGRGAEAVLPERWVVRVYKGGQLRHTAWGKPIPEPLNLTPDPSDDVQQMVEVADTYQVPARIAWTVKYQTALDQGMAVEIGDLSTDELTGGFDRVIVFGAKTSFEGPAGGTFVRSLVDAQHFTRGLALVPQGTASNNVPGRPTPFTDNDPPGADSFRTQRLGGTADDVPEPDFDSLARILGVRNSDLAFIPGAESGHPQQETMLSGCMQDALWPATLGYFMQQMMNSWAYLVRLTNATPIFDDQTIQQVRSFFNNFVRARGPAPVFRVGAVPYGVLPVMSLARMVPNPNVENATPIDLIRRLLPQWLSAASTLPSVGRDPAGAGNDFLNVIGRQASSENVFIRRGQGPQLVTSVLDFLGYDPSPGLNALQAQADRLMRALGQPTWAKARVLELTYLNGASAFNGPLVTATPGDDGKLPANGNYIAKLADLNLSIDQLITQDSMSNVEQPRPLLFLLLRHALLLEVVRIGRLRFAADMGPPDQVNVEFEHNGIAVNETHQAIFDVLTQVEPDGGGILFERIKAHPVGEYASYVGSLFVLKDVPVRDLERMMMETLDLTSHRLDAWITALATRRIDHVRDTSADLQENYLGGYGWVEDVKPTARGSKTVEGLGPADVQPGNGGFIHTPSLRHAAAAAILRNARLVEQKDPQKYSVELTSERARRARRMIEAVRAGQPLGAQLGYELERGLRQRKVTPPTIRTLRKLFPLVANKSGFDGNQPADRVGAQNVVDGQLVRQAAAQQGGFPFGTRGLPASGSDDGIAISAELVRLEEMIDAVGDLSIAESVYQLASGDVASAQAMLSFLPDGNNPPDPELTRSQPVGLGLSHRVALLFEGDSTKLPDSLGWAVGTRRGLADTFLERWAGGLLGRAGDANADVTFVENNQPGSVTYNLGDLGIGALDFVALAQGTSASGQGSALDRRLRAKLHAQHTDPTDIVITYRDPDPTTPNPRSIPQLIELARALGTFLGSARELRAGDLRRPEDPLDQTAIDAQAGALAQQANEELVLLSDAVAALSSSDLPGGLVGAATYLADAFPDPEAGTTELETRASGARTELQRRFDDATAALAAAPTVAAAVSALRIIFGKNTLAVMPSAVPQGAGELRQSLRVLDKVAVFGDDAKMDLHHAPGRFLQQAMRTRPALGAWRRFDMYARAFGAAAPRPAVAQLPFIDGEDWVGRSAPTDSRVSLLLLRANGQGARPDDTVAWRGLVLDEWTELVPSGKVETGLAFHYDSQNAEAPQAILVARYSGQPNGWTMDEFSAILNETIDLARIRPVASQIVGLGELIPGIYLAANTGNTTVSTLFGAGATHAQDVVAPTT